MTAFLLDAVELLENADTRNDAGAELAKMDFNRRSVAAPRGFDQAPRIALSKRTCLDKGFEREISRCCPCFR